VCPLVLNHVPVVSGLDVEVAGISDFVGGDDGRSNRRRALEGLRGEPVEPLGILRTNVLQVTCSNIVKHGISCDVVEGVRLVDVAAWFPDDCRQFAFVVEIGRDPRIVLDRFIVADEGPMRLREDRGRSNSVPVWSTSSMCE